MQSTPKTAPLSSFIGMQIEEETSGICWTARSLEPGIVRQRIEQERLAGLDHAARDAAADKDAGVLHDVVRQAVRGGDDERVGVPAAAAGASRPELP